MVFPFSVSWPPRNVQALLPPAPAKGTETRDWSSETVNQDILLQATLRDAGTVKQMRQATNGVWTTMTPSHECAAGQVISGVFAVVLPPLCPQCKLGNINDSSPVWSWGLEQMEKESQRAWGPVITSAPSGNKYCLHFPLLYSRVLPWHFTWEWCSHMAWSKDSILDYFLSSLLIQLYFYL